METRQLFMYFETDQNKDVSISVEDPKNDLIPEEIKVKMDQLIASGALTGSSQEKLVKAKSARIVVRTVNELGI